MNCCSPDTGQCRLSVPDCFDRGLKTRRRSPLPVVGVKAESAAGLWAQFSLQMVDEEIADVAFECASCTTLIACCQALADLGSGTARQVALGYTSAIILDRLTSIPVYKRDRAVLAAQAFYAALAALEREHYSKEEMT